MDRAMRGNPDAQLASARALLGRKLYQAAWDAAQAAPASAQRCALEVEILIRRVGENDLETALKVIERWRRLQPASPEPWARKFEIALRQYDVAGMDAALVRLQRAAPGHARTFYYQALGAQIRNRIPEALEFYEIAAKQQFPGYSLATRQVLAASKAMDTAMGNHPGSRRSDAALALGQPEVVDALEARLELWDTQSGSGAASESSMIAQAWHKLARVRMRGIVHAEKCLHYSERALQLNPNHQAAHGTYLFALNYDTCRSPEQIYSLHVAKGDRFASRFPERRQRFSNPNREDKLLRVAYLSTDLRRHPVAYFILPVLQHHDAGVVLSHVYHLHATWDDYTERAAKAAYHFRHVFDFDDPALASQIEKDGIDILVDLNGNSGRGRLSLLARRAAPVQMTWLGCPNTTGLPTVDYRIVDQNTDPPPSAQAWNREQLLYLPRLFSIYDPLGQVPPVVDPPCVRNRYITFGSFNNVTKINSRALSLWGRVLSRVPESRLLIKHKTLDFEAVRKDLLGMLRDETVDITRVELVGSIKYRDQHLESYSLVDVHLDTFPYHGTTTTCESLMMGVPVVTLAGADHRSRVGVSLLTSVGRKEWIARVEDEYVDIASHLASDPEALAKTRSVLRAQVQASALMDAPRFTRELEQAYRDCWVRWCRSPDRKTQ